MRIEKLFNLVAPIAIYHRTDVCYKRKAASAWGKIRKLAAKVWKDAGCEAPDITETIDDLEDWSKDAYDKLLWTIVEERYPDWSWEHDKWGARTVYDQDKEVVISGDACYCFPWYETAELLIVDLEEHEAGRNAEEL